MWGDSPSLRPRASHGNETRIATETTIATFAVSSSEGPAWESPE